MKKKKLFYTDFKPGTMDLTEFKEKAEDLVEQLENLIQEMPQKGNTSEECQRITLQIAINEVSYAISGTEESDFIEDEN